MGEITKTLILLTYQCRILSSLVTLYLNQHRFKEEAGLKGLIWGIVVHFKCQEDHMKKHHQQ